MSEPPASVRLALPREPAPVLSAHHKVPHNTPNTPSNIASSTVNPVPTGTTSGLTTGARPRSGADPLALPAGSVLSEFRVRRVLGCGGFGIVYLVWDDSLQRDVALKEYLPAALAGRAADGRVVARSAEAAEPFDAGLRSFVNEARLLARFDHPSLVKVHRFWEANGTAYMVMPYYQGATLRQVRKSLGEPPTEAWLQRLLDGLLGALDALHRADVLHRDVAPDNIMMMSDGAPVLLDFGAARHVLAEQAQALTAMLKPTYAPLEQYADAAEFRQGPWTDLYATAATLHYCLTGQAPPNAAARALNDRYRPLHQRSELRQHDGTPYNPRWLSAIDWALEVLPNRRPQSIAQWRAVLDGRRSLPGTSLILRLGFGSPAAAPARPRPREDVISDFPATEVHARWLPEAPLDDAAPAAKAELTLIKPMPDLGAPALAPKAMPVLRSLPPLEVTHRWRPSVIEDDEFEVPVAAGRWRRWVAAAGLSLALVGGAGWAWLAPVERSPSPGTVSPGLALTDAGVRAFDPAGGLSSVSIRAVPDAPDEIHETTADQGRVITVPPRVFEPVPSADRRAQGVAPAALAASDNERALPRTAGIKRASSPVNPGSAALTPRAHCEAGDRSWFSRMLCMHQSCGLDQWRDHPQCANWTRPAVSSWRPEADPS